MSQDKFNKKKYSKDYNRYSDSKKDDDTNFDSKKRKKDFKLKKRFLKEENFDLDQYYYDKEIE